MSISHKMVDLWSHLSMNICVAILLLLLSFKKSGVLSTDERVEFVWSYLSLKSKHISKYPVFSKANTINDFHEFKRYLISRLSVLWLTYNLEKFVLRILSQSYKQFSIDEVSDNSFHKIYTCFFLLLFF